MVPFATEAYYVWWWWLVDLGSRGRFGVVVPFRGLNPGVTPLPAQLWPGGLLKRMRRA
jgi:hypothetical protein